MRRSTQRVRHPWRALGDWTRSAVGSRRTVRARLTAAYGGVFLASGAAVLTVAYLLVRHFADVLSAGGSETVQVSTGAGDSAKVSVFGPSPASGVDASGGIAGNTVHHGLPPGVLSGPGPTKTGAPAGPTTSQLNHIRTELLDLLNQQHQAVLHSLLIWSAVALAGAAVIALVLGWWMAGRALRPLRSITLATRSISARNLHERLAYTGAADEVRDLADTIDKLLERLEGAFEAQRRFVANASHELRTPLARQRTIAEVAIADPAASVESLRASHARVIAAGEQQERLIDALLTLARSDRGLDHHEPVDLAALAQSALNQRSADALRRGIHVREELAPVAAAGDGQLLERLLTNLVDNAIDHNLHEGWVEVSTAAAGERARVRVANSGPEVPEGEVARLLQPFQRLGRDRTGSGDHRGLGLAIVQAIVAAHDGQLRLSPNPGGGLVVEVVLPSAVVAGVEVAVSVPA